MKDYIKTRRITNWGRSDVYAINIDLNKKILQCKFLITLEII